MSGPINRLGSDSAPLLNPPSPRQRVGPELELDHPAEGAFAGFLASRLGFRSRSRQSRNRLSGRMQSAMAGHGYGCLRHFAAASPVWRIVYFSRDS